MDMEGHNLGSKGTLSLLQLYPEDGKIVWLIDVTVLVAKAFDTSASGDKLTLRQLMESPQTKVARRLFMSQALRD